MTRHDDLKARLASGLYLMSDPGDRPMPWRVPVSITAAVLLALLALAWWPAQ